MPRYAVAFHSPSGSFIHKVIDMDSENASLQFFFQNFVGEDYTKDQEGYNYFLEDFQDTEEPLGNILEI